VRRILERYGYWIALILLAVGAAWQRNWLWFVLTAVAAAGFAVMRPLDRRANRRMRD
jgi:hypothetical protein